MRASVCPRMAAADDKLWARPLLATTTTAITVRCSIEGRKEGGPARHVRSRLLVWPAGIALLRWLLACLVAPSRTAGQLEEPDG